MPLKLEIISYEEAQSKVAEGIIERIGDLNAMINVGSLVEFEGRVNGLKKATYQGAEVASIEVLDGDEKDFRKVVGERGPRIKIHYYTKRGK